MMLLTLALLLASTSPVRSGFGPPPNPSELLQRLYGNPCDCKGGTSRVTPKSFTKITDCNTKTAYLVYLSQIGGGFTQQWECVLKPKTIPTVDGSPGPCPKDCQIVTELHSTCYSSVQQCTHSDGKIYLTTVLQRTYSGSFGGEYDHSNPTGHSKYARASCRGQVGKDTCWPPQAPIHVSDGGGPTDRLKEAIIEKTH